MHEPPRETNPTPHLKGDDGEDRIVAATDFLKGILSTSGSAHWKADTPRQKTHLTKWANSLDLVLDHSHFLPVIISGGQEHDYYLDEENDRCVKITRNGVFGLSPGIELALVPSDEDARRFHLWEASPYQYLERLRLQNILTPGLNRLEGLIIQEDDLALCISQPRFELIPVTQDEIDQWFESLGFHSVTKAAYYRPQDNLGVFDAHDKNVVRSSLDPTILIPFDVIPVQPDGGFLEFIQDTLDSGQSLEVIRTAKTTTRVTT